MSGTILISYSVALLWYQSGQFWTLDWVFWMTTWLYSISWLHVSAGLCQYQSVGAVFTPIMSLEDTIMRIQLYHLIGLIEAVILELVTWSYLLYIRFCVSHLCSWAVQSGLIWWGVVLESNRGYHCYQKLHISLLKWAWKWDISSTSCDFYPFNSIPPPQVRFSNREIINQERLRSVLRKHLSTPPIMVLDGFYTNQ